MKDYEKELVDFLTLLVKDGDITSEARDCAWQWWETLKGMSKGLITVPGAAAHHGHVAFAWGSAVHCLDLNMEHGTFFYLNTKTAKLDGWVHTERPELTDMYLPYFYRQKKEAKS